MTDEDPLSVAFPNAAQPAQAAGASVARKVYIVDDDSMVRRSLYFALQTAGFEVRAFVSGRDFLEAADELPPGCVLLDIRMPEMDGIAVLNELGVRREHLPVVMMTGHGEVEVAVKAMKLGSRDFLEKPFTDAALLEVIEALFAALPEEAKAHDERRTAAAKTAKLTVRERELLRGLVTGYSNKEVASLLNISVRTVEMHRSNLMERLDVKSLAEVVRLAILAGVEPL